ncbi:hypothetical protein GCM10023170_007550 [Phytohabitans houttuyneae]|uniref:Uncharacterized protein n=1 Tax=Phytohabitans houttuyneae TaxID=1076126 RepID=A0A6V8K9L2_9ACTN|nr:hypothetical protein Phou_033110 [Phytohabitans houttuyneae]
MIIDNRRRRQLGADSGISKSEVCRIYADLDGEVAMFRDRSLAAGAFAYTFLAGHLLRGRLSALLEGARVWAG